MDDQVKVTVSFGGRERRIPLAVRPALELSDEQVEFAEADLMAIVRHVFRVPSECTVDLHETEGGRIMTRESFRDPSYLPSFPRHWYLTTETVSAAQNLGPLPTAEEDDEELDEKPSMAVIPPALESMATTDEPLVSLAELSCSEMKYKSVDIHCDSVGQFGFSLRHFTIQPSNIPRSATPEGSRPDSRSSMHSTDSLNTLKLSTTFVYELDPSGPAILAGLKEGDVVHMINDVGIIRSGVEEVEELLQQCGDDLCLLVLPKENDDLQFLYPQYTYGSAGDHETSDGKVCACDLPVVVGTESEILDCKKPSSLTHRVLIPHPLPANGSLDSPATNLNASEGGPEKLGSPPHGLIPFTGSEQSLDRSLSCSNDNDILITASLSEIPIGPAPGDGQPSALGLQQETSSHDSLPGLQQLSELSPTWQHSEQSDSPRHDLPPPLSSSSSSHPATSSLQFVSEDTGKLDSDWYDYNQTTSVPDNYLPKSEELESSASDYFLSGRGVKRRAGRGALERDLQLRKTPLLPPLRGRAGLAVSTPALDQVGVAPRAVSQEMSHSTELGVFKLKKKGRQSLEALTRIGSDEPFTRNRPAPIKRHRSDENALKLRSFKDSSWVGGSREAVVSNKASSEHSGSQPERVSSSQSTSEGQKTSQDGVFVAANTAAVTGAAKPRRGAKSYQTQRAKLHKRSSQKCLTGSLDSEDHHRPLRPRRRLSSRDDEEEVGGRRVGKRRSFKTSPPINSQEAIEQPKIPEEPDALRRPAPEESLRPHSYENVRPVIQATPASPEEDLPRTEVLTRNMRHPVHRERPASVTENSSQYLALHKNTVDPRQRLTHSVEVSAVSRKIPLHKTMSAQTPHGEQEYTEVPIDEVIRSRQLLSPHYHSLDSGVVVSDRGGEDGEVTAGVQRKKAKNWNLFGAGKSKLSKALTASDDRLFPGRSPSPSDRRMSSDATLTTSTAIPAAVNISTTCHGILHKKQERGEDGRKSNDRSWKTYFAVLRGNQIVFYKDRKDAEMGKPVDESPVAVVPSSTDIARDYSKKKFVFRVVTAQGAELLMQAEDHESMRRWVSEVQRLNGGSPKPPEISRPLEIGLGKLAPPSPTPLRRFASPVPNKPKDKKKDRDEGSSKPKLLTKLRKTITRSRETEEQDTSTLTFGQLLQNCPTSSDNKNVPLLVDVCVKEVEKHGLQTEGIYRKAGPGSVVKMIIAEMDKGNYTLPPYEDIHIMSSVLKKFLKELPDPLIPVALYDDFIACAREEREERRINRLKELVYYLPTAHYHTLKFLMTHLRKVTTFHDVNKMSVRNVSLVFGPTLVRNPTKSDDLLVSAINAGYTVVELLCRHVEQLFVFQRCAEEEAEEQQFKEQCAAMADEEARLRTNSEPAISVHELRQQQKDNALLKASPKLVRRIRNDLNSRQGSVDSGKVTAADISLPLQRKLQNWESHTTDTLRSNHSSGSSLPSPSHKSPEAPYAGHTPPHQATRIVQSYDDGNSALTHSSASQRTKHWVNQHNQLGWGVEERGRREAGSMWKTKELLQVQKERKERKRLSLTRGQVITSRSSQGEPGRDILLSYQGSQDPYASSRSSTFPNRGGNPALVAQQRGSTLPVLRTSQSQRQPPRRRVSYLEALGDSSQLRLSEETPVQDMIRSERYRGIPHYPTRREVDSRRFEATYHHDHRPQHRLMRVKSSEEPGEAVGWRGDGPHAYPYHSRAHYSSSTPPDRTLQSPQPPMTVNQLESYL